MNYKLNDEMIFADISDGIAILINVENGIYYGLNKFTTSIFENIINGADIDELGEHLKNTQGYDADAQKKYESFLSELVDKSFILESSSSPSELRLNVDKYDNDELDFVLSEYLEAAELLLADPIHQVKEETGWGPNREALK